MEQKNNTGQGKRLPDEAIYPGKNHSTCHGKMGMNGKKMVNLGILLWLLTG